MQTLSYLRDSRTTWLGPCSPCDLKAGSKEQAMYGGNIDYLQTKMGYRFRVSKVNKLDSVKAGSNAEVTLTMTNDGICPAYRDYSVCVVVLPENDSEDKKDFGIGTKDFAACDLMPGQSEDITVSVPVSSSAEGKCRLAVCVVGKNSSDQELKPVMNLGMANEIGDKMYELYEIEVTK